MGLGATHTTDLAEARQNLRDGIDPLTQRRAAKGATTGSLTFAEAASRYITHSALAGQNETLTNGAPPCGIMRCR